MAYIEQTTYWFTFVLFFSNLDRVFHTKEVVGYLVTKVLSVLGDDLLYLFFFSFGSEE